jgi:hypothetical protein
MEIHLSEYQSPEVRQKKSATLSDRALGGYRWVVYFGFA